MQRGEEAALWFCPVQGGASRRVGDVMAKEGVWSPTGDMIAFVRGETILITDTQGSDAREVARFKLAPHSLLWSPDGKRLRFTRTSVVEGTDSVWEIGIDGKSLRRVLPGEEGGPHEGSGTWLAGGNYFAFSTGQDLRANLAVDTQANLWLLEEKHGGVGSHSGDPVQLTEGPMGVDHPTWAAVGARVFAIGSPNGEQLPGTDPKTMTKTAV